MGREVKRVPLDFDWPLRSRWKGYINPHYRACAECGGGGETASAKALRGWVDMLLRAGEVSLRSRSLYPRGADASIKDPGDLLHEVSSGLAGQEPRSPFGYSSTGGYRAIVAILKAAGLPKRWGWCPACRGTGIAAEVRRRHARWRPTHPPTGAAWQVWETVSEGSPVSPPCESPEALARWMADHPDGSVTHGMSYDAWLVFIHTGWAPSFVYSPEDGLQAGVEAVGRLILEGR